MSPAPRGSAGAGLGDGSCEAAVSSTELTTDRLIEERLKTRFGLSPERARAIASLAQLGSREARHG
jgi:hypothetical protein